MQNNSLECDTNRDYCLQRDDLSAINLFHGSVRYSLRLRKIDFHSASQGRGREKAPRSLNATNRRSLCRTPSCASRSVWACSICECPLFVGWQRCVIICTPPWRRYRVAMTRQRTWSTACSPGVRRCSASRWRRSCRAARITISGTLSISRPSTAGKFPLRLSDRWPLFYDVSAEDLFIFCYFNYGIESAAVVRYAHVESLKSHL